MGTFSLAGRGLKLDSEEDAALHLQPLWETETPVTRLDVSGNTLGIGACSALATAIRQQTHVEWINLADIFTGRLRQEIPPSLDSLLGAVLEVPVSFIDLSDNAFGLLGVAPLVRFLSSHAPLVHLHLHNNGLGPDAGSQIGQALVDLAEKKRKTLASPSLETIICGRNRLENGSMQNWAKAVASHPGLKCIKMVQNGIRPEGIYTLLAEGLTTLTNLEILDLQDNTFSHRGAIALASALPSWPQIRELGVGDCLLSARGGLLLGQTLQQRKNAKLKILRLQYNEIAQDGLGSIVTAIEHSLEQLQLLELNGNKFEEDHQHVEKLRGIFSERGIGELDELDDMEEASDASGASDDDASNSVHEDLVRADEICENSAVPQESDEIVDRLADAIGSIAVR